MRWDHLRAEATAVACPQPKCLAEPGEPCRNVGTGAPLGRRPAHERRLWAAGVLPGPDRVPPCPDAYREGDPR